jgi:hypothetical protein
MALQSKGSNLIGCGLETARIETAVEVGGDLKSGLGSGGAGVVEDLRVGIQRFAAGLVRPFPADKQLQQHRLSQPDRLYRKVTALDLLLHAVGLKAA